MIISNLYIINDHIIYYACKVMYTIKLEKVLSNDIIRAIERGSTIMDKAKLIKLLIITILFFMFVIGSYSVYRNFATKKEIISTSEISYMDSFSIQNVKDDSEKLKELELEVAKYNANLKSQKDLQTAFFTVIFILFILTLLIRLKK